MDRSGHIIGNLRIRVMERADIENARILHNEYSVLKNLTDVRFVSEAEQEIWFKNISESSSSSRFVVEEIDGDFVGVFRLDALDKTNRNAMVGMDITEKKRSKGYAKITFIWMIKYLFDEMGLHRLSLNTLENNHIAIKLYKKLGFEEEGVHREAIWRDGKFHDLIQFSLLNIK